MTAAGNDNGPMPARARCRMAGVTSVSRTVRGLARWLGLPLLAGLLTTIALVGAIAWSVPTTGGRHIGGSVSFQGRPPDPVRSWHIMRADKPGTSRLFWMARSNDDFPWYPMNLFGDASWSDAAAAWTFDWPDFGRFGLPMNSSAGFPPSPEWGDQSMGLEIAHGFPFRAFWCAPEFVPGTLNPAYRVRGGLQLSPDLPGATGTLRVLPYRPVWPGLAADVGIYAALWLLVVGGVLQGRRALRAHRGRCRACGYDLAGQTARGCPECGWERSNEAANSTV